MSNARTGSMIGATWLIGLGIVFLVQRAADLPWSQAWPMFVILVGVAGFVSTVINRRWDYSGVWAFTWPVAWIVVGSLLLASTTGTIGTGPGDLIGQYWPWLLIILGVWFLIGAFLPTRPGHDRDAGAAARWRDRCVDPDPVRSGQPDRRPRGGRTARRRDLRGRRHDPDERDAAGSS